VGNWFGKGKRGLIFGLWNSHTSVGNILGSIIAGEYVESNWGLSFIVPGAVIGVAGFLIFLFLVPKPQHVHCTLPDHSGSDSTDLSQSSDYPSVIIIFLKSWCCLKPNTEILNCCWIHRLAPILFVAESAMVMVITQKTATMGRLVDYLK